MSASRRLEPLLLLLGAGLCIGLIFPLSRLAVELGVAPLVYVGCTAFGAALVLALLTLVGRHPLHLRKDVLIYAAVAGLLTFAIPWSAVVIIIPHLGSGIPAIVQSLAPIITLGIAYAAAVERPDLIKTLGLLLGVLGAMLILASRGNTAVNVDVSKWWYVAALVTPTVLGAGNVYRTKAWPTGGDPLSLAALTLTAAALALCAAVGVLCFLGLHPPVSDSFAVGWPIILLQCLLTGMGYGLFFRLQQVGGPIYVSQISYVNTAVGVGFAVILFAEVLLITTWIALVLIVCGLAMVNRRTSGNH